MIDRRRNQRNLSAVAQEPDDMPNSTEAISYEKEGWSLDRKMLVSLTAFVVPMAISSLVAFTDVRARVSVVEASRTERISIQHDRDERQDTEVRERFTQIQNQLDNVNSKLDRLILQGSPK